MSISSISSSAPVQAPPKPAPTETAEATNAGKDVRNDGDTDDAAASAPPPPQPTTNNMGQQIGKNLNVSA
jgi:hypothetical protein